MSEEEKERLICEIAGRVFGFTVSVIAEMYAIDNKAVLARVAEIARGEVSIYNNPTEELKKAGQQRVSPLTDAEQEAFVANVSRNRADLDSDNQISARRIFVGLGRLT